MDYSKVYVQTIKSLIFDINLIASPRANHLQLEAKWS